MEDRNVNVCRVCLKVISCDEAQILDPIAQDMLKVVVPNINLTICDNPTLCQECYKTMLNCYTFKNDIKEKQKTNSSCSGEGTTTCNKHNLGKKCNVCKKTMNKESSSSVKFDLQGQSLKEVLKTCVPEWTLTKNTEIVPCNPCLETLISQFSFIGSCSHAENSLKSFMSTREDGEEKFNLFEAISFIENRDQNSSNLTKYDGVFQEHMSYEIPKSDIKSEVMEVDEIIIKTEVPDKDLDGNIVMSEVQETQENQSAEQPCTSSEEVSVMGNLKDIKLGELFESYEDFIKSLRYYCDEEYVSFYKREARTVSAAKKKTERYINPKLKFYQLKYACVKGGKDFKSGTIEKRNTSTYKEGCNAHITLRATKCGNYLQITSFDTHHNHAISKHLYEHYAHQRRLPSDIRSEIIHLAKLKTKRKEIIKCYIEEERNKIVLLKDFNDIIRKFSKSDTRNETLESSIQKLKIKYGADCEVLSDIQNNFKALFLQTNIMKQYMEVYPEFICVDSTFKLIDVRTTVLMLMNEDGNGLSEIIAVGILHEETADNMQWFLSKFKENNPKWSEVKAIMADKDLNEKRLLKENFPNAEVVIRIFHVISTFNREISTKTLNITQSQRQTALGILRKMVHSRDSLTYNSLYAELLKSCPISVVEYFNKNWHDVKNEWTLDPEFQRANFLNTTNSILESLNAKVKSMVERYSTLSKFIDDFFKFIMMVNQERDRKAADFISKNPVSCHKTHGVLHKYLVFLTGYAFEFVKQQFLDRHDSNPNYNATPQSCSCDWRTSMLLPCRHILKLREEIGMDLYEEELCNVRWTRRHYSSSQRLFLTDRRIGEPDCNLQQSKSLTLNQRQRFSKACKLLKALAGVISEDGDARYQAKLRQLIQLKTAWESDRNVSITEQVVDTQDINLNYIRADVKEESANEVCEVIEESNGDGDNMTNDYTFKVTKDDAIPLPEGSNSNNLLDISNISLPAATKRRGGPKGRNTFVGVSRKRSKEI